MSIVIPAFNEEARLPSTLDRLIGSLDDAIGPDWEIVVSDDGSTDSTAARVVHRSAAEPRLRLVSAAVNAGKGAAIRSGTEAAGFDLVLLLDADLPVPVSTFAPMIEQAEVDDLVVGSRRMPGSTFTSPQPLSRRLAGTCFLAAVSWLGYSPTSDPQCGVKLFRRARIMPLLDQVASKGFAFDIEMMQRARLAGLRIGERPVEWTHVSGSSVRPLRDGFGTLRDLARVRRHLPRETVTTR